MKGNLNKVTLFTKEELRESASMFKIYGSVLSQEFLKAMFHEEIKSRIIKKHFPKLLNQKMDGYKKEINEINKYLFNEPTVKSKKK